MAPDISDLLKSAALFSSCTAEDIEIAASHCVPLTFSRGECVFREGDESGHFYLVRQGEIVIRKTVDEGSQVDIARFVAGDCFGELDLFTGEPRNAAAAVTEDASLLVFPAAEGGFGAFLEEFPGVGGRLLRGFLVQISARIRGVNSLVRDNSPLVQDLRRQVYVDKLTGLFNKTSFEEQLDRVLNTGTGTTGLLMYKPDNFKEINDTWGHEAGDRVLRRIADGLCELVPDRDMLFRYMGNENALILPGAGREEVLKWASLIGEYLRNLDLEPLLGTKLKLSVSFGLGVAPEHGHGAAELAEAVHPLPLEGRRRGGNLCLFPEDLIES